MTRKPAQTLPRDTRDTLFLLSVLAWTLAPQMAHVPAWASAMAAIALLVRAGLAWRQKGLPPRSVTLAALLAACGMTWFSHGSFFGRDAGLTLLVVLAALKTLELRARRDATVVFFLGFVLVLANFLHSQSLALALGMGVSVWGLLAALMLSNRPVGRPHLRQVLGQCARLVAWGTPLVAVLFLLFPRIGPLWGQPGDMGGRTGLSDRLHLGDVAQLAQDESLALRLRTSGPLPPPSERYFRGPVLSDLRPDGQWVARPAELQFMLIAPGGRGSSDRVSAEPHGGDRQPYELILEPLRVRTLPLPEMTSDRPLVEGSATPIYATPDGVWTAEQALQDRLRIRGLRLTQWRLPGSTTLAAARQGLDADRALPDGPSPALRAWARDWFTTLPKRDSASVVAAVLAHIRRQPYRYTLVPGEVPRGVDPMDHFWLTGRAGFCEHYAAATVTLLRTVGIPARIVTGYQGGQVNPVDGVLEVRQSDAHAWIEYWHHDAGWVRADPTAAVAPERIERTARLKPPPGPVEEVLWPGEPPAWTQQMQALWGAADHRWNEWVLGYSAQRQRDRLRQLGWDAVDAVGLLRLLGGLLGGSVLLVLGGLAARTAWRRRRPARDPWLRAWEQARSGLPSRGIAVAGHEAPSAVAARVRGLSRGDPSTLQALADALDAFERARYARPASDGRSVVPHTRRALRRAIATLPRV